MAKANDERILELKKQIEAKKEKLGKSKRFSPITNCFIDLDGQRYNINVLQKEDLKLLLVKLNSYFVSMYFYNKEEENDLKIDSLTISGYGISDWMSDVENKLNMLSRKDEERKLKAMEDKLTQLLSEDKQTELQIDEIAKLLENE